LVNELEARIAFLEEKNSKLKRYLKERDKLISAAICFALVFFSTSFSNSCDSIEFKLRTRPGMATPEQSLQREQPPISLPRPKPARDEDT
jgi:hypothetical protein